MLTHSTKISMNLNVDFNLKGFFSSVFGKEFWDIIFLSIAVSPKKNKTFYSDKEDNNLKTGSIFKAFYFVLILNSAAT